MVTKNKIIALIMIIVFLLTCFVFASDTNQTSEPSYKRFKLTAEEMSKLEEMFQEFHQKLDIFLELNRQAEKELPGLIDAQVAFIRMKKITYSEYPGSDKVNSFSSKINPNSDEQKKYERIFLDCREPFAAKLAADYVQDPYWSDKLKNAYILKYRHTYGGLEESRKDRNLKFERRKTLEGFNANEPNDQILWENIREHIIEVSKSYKDERNDLMLKMNIENTFSLLKLGPQAPSTFGDGAGYPGFAKEMRLWTGGWIRLYAPKYVISSFYEVSERSDILLRYNNLMGTLYEEKRKGYEEFRKNLSWETYQLFLEGKIERVSDDDYFQNKFLYELRTDFYAVFFMGY